MGALDPRVDLRRCCFFLLVANQTLLIAQFASVFHPYLGKAVIVVVTAVLAATLITPVALYLRFPKPLRPPESAAAAEFAGHLAALAERLRSNSHTAWTDSDAKQVKTHLEAQRIEDAREKIEGALRGLEKKADEVARRVAEQVFISTALSQNGRLDALVVLTAQIHMIWRISRIFNQTASPRDLIRLYANVWGTAFVAGELEDLQLDELVEPVMSSLFGSLSAAVPVPGLQLVVSKIVDSLLNGTINAFLTLRVGMITKRYCRSLVVLNGMDCRRAAAIEAAEHLRGVVSETGPKIFQAFYRSIGKRMTEKVKNWLQWLQWVPSVSDSAWRK
jgi:hypothetical protein